MSKIILAVHERLAGPSKEPRKFDQNINLYRLRLPVPVVRKAVKPTYSFVSNDRKNNLSAWDELWSKSDLYEAKSRRMDSKRSLQYLSGKMSRLSKEEFIIN